MSYIIEADWITSAGLRAICMLAQGTHRNGYVEVPKGHPLHGIGYNEPTKLIGRKAAEEARLGKKSSILAFTFDVHGGLTYSGSGETYPVPSDGWWFGFDCAHAGDGQLGRRARFSGGPVRSQEYVMSECEKLALQIVEMFPL